MHEEPQEWRARVVEAAPLFFGDEVVDAALLLLLAQLLQVFHSDRHLGLAVYELQRFAVGAEIERRS